MQQRDWECLNNFLQLLFDGINKQGTQSIIIVVTLLTAVMRSGILYMYIPQISNIIMHIQYIVKTGTHLVQLSHTGWIAH